MSRRIDAIVIGTSLGGPAALTTLLQGLQTPLSVPIFIVQHLSAASATILPDLLTKRTPIQVVEAMDKMPIIPGRAHMAPPNYHLLIEDRTTLALSIDSFVNYSRPSIDVLFESAARVYGQNLIGVLLTGANRDGSAGMRAIQHAGGITIVQNPATAECDIMPNSALEVIKVDYTLNVEHMGTVISRLLDSPFVQDQL